MSKVNKFPAPYFTPSMSATQRGCEKMMSNGQRVRVVLRRYGTFDEPADGNRLKVYRRNLDLFGDPVAAMFTARHAMRLHSAA